MQIGEFSYLLAQTGRSVGAISEELNSLILTSSVVTIILTPLGFRLAPNFGRLLDRLPALGGRLGAPAFAPYDQPALVDHAVVIGHGRVGGAVADRLLRAGVQAAVVDEDLHLVQYLRTVGVSAVYGDAVYPSVLQAAHPERAHLIVVPCQTPAPPAPCCKRCDG
jgi:CPA2 family monovalent cation:H+ antiporter-2